MIFGVDVHPRYQQGFDVERAAREGIAFMACKLSEARSSAAYVGSHSWIERGKRAGMMCLGYHYFRAGRINEQADLFSDLLKELNVPGMVDAEDGAGGIDQIRGFVDALRERGANIPLLYLPRWYWQQIGSPDLRGLPALWASRYPSQQFNSPEYLFQHVRPEHWAGYGGGQVEVLQFASTGVVAGTSPVDVNAYRGTAGQFAQLLSGGGDDMTPDESKKLTELHAEVLARKPSLAPGAQGPGHQLTEYVRYVDSRTMHMEQMLHDVQSALDDLRKRLPAS